MLRHALYFGVILAVLSNVTLATAVLTNTDIVGDFKHKNNGTGNACSILARRFPRMTLLPNDTAYTPVVNNSWSKTCVIPPSCVFLPNRTADVSAAVKVLARTQTKFAIRSGGHMPVPGANSISDGVLIVLSRLDTMELVDRNKTARIGAGLKWKDVYQWISPYGLGVSGGRFTDVGVGGLLLGGGVSHFGSQYGWSTDLVTNFEVVLADGRVVNANRKKHTDLFWALKGGAGNFGIVTKFELSTFPATDFYGGLIYYTSSHFNDLATAVANYMEPGVGGMLDSYSAIEPVMIITPSTGAMQGGTLVFRQGSDAAPASLQNFTAIPSLYKDTSLRTNLWSVMGETNNALWNDYSHRQLYFTITLKGVPESVYLVNDTFIPLALNSLKTVKGFTTSINHQPVSQSLLAKAKENGGDVLDLDPANGALNVIGISSSWSDAADDEAVFDFSVKAIDALTTAAKAAGLYDPFLYLNDGDPSQNPFATYGGGKSLPRLREVAKCYDPSGVFQTLVAGGFKLW